MQLRVYLAVLREYQVENSRGKNTDTLIFKLKLYDMKRILLMAIVIFTGFSCTFNDQHKDKSGTVGENDYFKFTSGLTEDTACLLSQIAYTNKSDSTLLQYMPGWSLMWEGKELNGNHAFVASNGRDYALAIRGSLINFSWAAFQNWISQDLHVTTQEKWPFAPDSLDARVSAGSFTGWQNLEAMQDLKSGRLLLPVLDSILDLGAPLLITGHSLGGNLATVYGSYLVAARTKKGKNNNPVNIITFGAPAAGNEGFVTDYSSKFPRSVRVENKFDIVPKFPAARQISSLGELFTDSLSAATINVGYKSLQVPLSRVFSLITTSFSVLEFTNGLSPYVQTNGKGKQISIPLSGKNQGNEVMDWLNEAAYQHSIGSYATYEKVPVIPEN